MGEVIAWQTSLNHGQATVTGSLTLRAYDTSRQSIFIQNLGAGTLYIGGSGVTTSVGIQLIPNGNIILDKSQGAAIYCVPQGTCDVRFVEETTFVR